MREERKKKTATSLYIYSYILKCIYIYIYSSPLAGQAKLIRLATYCIQESLETVYDGVLIVIIRCQICPL